MFNQKEIVLIHFPYSDLTFSKKRPALIISNEKINKTQDRICCLITTKPHKEDLMLSKDSFEEGILPFKSFVKAHRIFTIHEKIIIKKLCKINSDFHDSVIKKINEYVKL
ncbi:type II toxin-antitoxin system PemK/MazF family toxin [Candidatus Pacearchaeota archaeon]|nr:type II toxin-antitoxin system PemK/MazF family toxin [Candidatus Pacearchaeota archaeon]